MQKLDGLQSSRSPGIGVPFARDSTGLLWQELDVGEYHIWLRSGIHYNRWEFGFQYRPQHGPQGPMIGPIFLGQPPKLPGDFDTVKDMALEAIRVDRLRRRAKLNATWP